MPDTLDKDGLQVKTAAELRAELQDGFKEIYGADINIDADSPDGQLIELITQEGVDIRDLATKVYNSFDPDFAQGVTLDQRVTINNIQRQAGDFTLVNVEITTDKALILDGLDAAANDPDAVDAYTVSDDAGNQYLLVDTTTFLAAGTKSLSFRAKELGQVEVTISTIQTQVTVVLGVTGVDNPAGATQTGDNQESDIELRTRRIKSVAKGSTHYVDSIRASLLNVSGVVDGEVYENVTDTIDSDSIPPHSIWAIVEGGANTDIAESIYSTKSDGSDMKGSVASDIYSDSGQKFTMKFDRPLSQVLYIQMDIRQTDPTAVISTSAIKEYLEDNLEYRIGQAADSSEITCLVADFVEGGVPINVEVSDDDATYVEYLETTSKQYQWTISEANISISVIT